MRQEAAGRMLWTEANSQVNMVNGTGKGEDSDMGLATPSPLSLLAERGSPVGSQEVQMSRNGSLDSAHSGP